MTDSVDEEARDRPLAGRIALITGASRGIGAAAALRLAKAGAHVVLLARTVGGLEEVDDAIKAVGGTGGTGATLIPCDLGDLARLDALGPSLLERFGGLDIFIANAAMMGPLSPLGHYDPAVWQRVFAINLTANWHLVRTLDPLLRRAEAGRAVFLTDAVAAAPRAYWGPYAASKAALESLAFLWAAETRRTPLKVNLFDPGPVRTALRRQAYPGEDPAGLVTPEAIVEALLPLVLPDLSVTGKRFVARP